MPFLIITTATNEHFSTAQTAQEIAKLPPDKTSVPVASYDEKTQIWDKAQSKLVARTAPSPSTDETQRQGLLGINVGVTGYTALQQSQALQLILKKLGTL